VKYLSVCSGIEAASVAWHPLGWEPVAFSEIEPFPSAVLAHHYPSVPNLGDMTKFQEWPDEPVDLLVGGTPCQSFSVAGLRKGLEDPRGNLMLTYLAIAQRYRPRWLVWENVPGVLSSNGGRDFGTFLGALGELGYGWAYRVLDAQWFGVAQRRRRVFVVGYLGDWQRAAKVLFERESVQRNPAPSREAREAVAGTIAARFGISRNNHEELAWTQCFAGSRQSDVAATLETTAHDYSRADNFNMVAQPIGFGAQMSVPQTDIDLMQTLQAKNPMAVAQPIPIHDQATRHAGKRGNNQDGKGNGLGIGQPGDPAPTLTKGDKHAVAQPVAFTRCDNGQDAQVDVTPTMRCGSNYSAHLAVAQPVYGTDCYNGAITGDVAATLGTPGSSVNASGPTVMQPVAYAIQGAATRENPASGPDGIGVRSDNCAYTIEARSEVQAVAYGIDGEQNASEELIGTLRSHQSGGYEGARVAQPVAFEPGSIARNAGPAGESPLAPTLRREMGDNQPAVRIAMQVRRLTPVECERLQGFPDGYTNIPWRKKADAPDGPRYKALGNSMAVPCMAWIGKRIAEVDRGD
jgi:DNA (cytosine-5)-methyltransferase 1